jgi:RNA polymerase sigma-70 factor, ECF subfamily
VFGFTCVFRASLAERTNFGWSVPSGTSPASARRVQPSPYHEPISLFLRTLGDHRPFIFQTALKFTRNHHDAEDICQEVLLRVWKHADNFRHDAAVSTWLFKITRNLAINFFRTQKPHTSLESSPAVQLQDQSVPDITAEMDFRAALQNGRDAMSLRERQAFDLRYYSGLCFEQIGDRLRTTPQNAKLITWRAKTKARAALAAFEA